MVETVGASLDHVVARERRDLMRMIFDAVYCDPREKRVVALQPKSEFVVLSREAGSLQEK